jgi:S1-C subfamily serine protease
MPVPVGTGFFISPVGHFITALHVVEGADLANTWLMARDDSPASPGAMAQWPELVRTWPEFDLALLKCDFGRNAEKAWLQGRSTFPYLKLEFQQQEDGTQVYSFGFPLPPPPQFQELDGMSVGFAGIGPRVTSAVIASSVWATQQIMFEGQPRFYVIDKALNYGNSGGPLVLQESGRAIGVAIQFQPVYVRQDDAGKSVVMVPSLYGKVSSLRNIEGFLRSELQLAGPG